MFLKIVRVRKSQEQD